MADNIKSTLQKAIEDYHLADSDYKKHLLQYEVAVLASELAVIGFLLQNSVTINIIKGRMLKITLALSLFSTFLSIVLMMLYKKYEAAYARESLHIEFYNTLSNPNVAVESLATEIQPIENMDAKKKEHMRKVIRYTDYLKKCTIYSELSFISGIAFALIFIGLLLVKI